MTALLRTVMVRQPAPPLSSEEWQAFGYLHPIDHTLAVRQHAALRETLVGEGIEVIAEGPDEVGYLDAIFPYDPSIITNEGAILLRMGKELRRDESSFHARTYGALGVPIFGVIDEPGTVEGGDTLWLDDRTLAIGRGYRTNESGIRQFRALLAEMDVEVLSYDLPHWQGAAACLHLMSLISPVAADLAVVYPPLMAVAFLDELRSRDWRLVEVPEEEFASMACNVLALAPGRCLMLEGNPETRRRLEAAGCEVLTYDGSEISFNREGGPTCLTRPIWRENDDQ